MNSRQRSVLIRVIIAVVVFIYIAWLAWHELSRADFWVITSFFILYFIWTMLSETILYQDPDTYVIIDKDNKSYLYLQLSFLIALFYATIDFVDLNLTRLKFLEPNIIYIGFILFVVSCFIRWWGFKSIGKFFNPRVALYEDHKLVTDGAYKVIRHPLYLGNMLGFIAIPLVFNSWGAMLIILLTTIPALIYRILIEEAFMLEHFPEEYAQYMESTKRIFPGLW